MAKKEKKVKENPLMTDSKKVKNIKIKNSVDDSDENEVKRFIIIILVIAIIAGIIYAATEIFKKDNNKIDETMVLGSINYDKVIIGTLLNRPDDNYYVLLYDIEASEAIKYSTLLTSYMQKKDDKDYIKIYQCDLGNSLNKNYYNVNNDNISNPKAKTIKELDLGDITLIRVKNGTIVEYIEDYTTIQNKLK